MKHLYSFSLLLLALLLPATALAHDIEVDGIYYNINGDEATVTYRGTNSWNHNTYSGDVTIPLTVTYNGTTYSVTSIGSNAFYYCTGLTSVIIPNSVTSIGESAFSGCSGLTSVDIPDSVTSIGNSAFSGCSGLTSIDIPNSVTSIGDRAFLGCSGLTSVTIPSSVTSIGDWAFERTPWYNNQPDGLVYAGLVAYKYKGTMPNGTCITLRDGTLGIAGSAFSGCDGLISVTIPNSVISIGQYAFSGCSSLASLTIPKSVTTIGGNAFDGCSGLTSITVASGNTIYNSRNNSNAIIETASNTLILGCMNTVIPNSVTTIGQSAFRGCSGLTSVNIPNSVTTIGQSAFRDCTGLTGIEIPNSVTTIGSSAFYGCSGLTSVTIPNSVTSIEHSTFYNCSSMASVTIGNSVTSIGSSAFYRCTGLTNITIPNSVTSIGDRAFYQCTSLASISITNPNFDITFGEDVFYGTAWFNNQPDGVVYIGLIAYRYKGIEPENSSITLRDGTIGIAGYAFNECYNLTNINIPNSVKYIGDHAFTGTSLTSVNIPNSISSIGDYAFSRCGLTRVTIPNSATYIGEGVFSECFGLTSVTLPYTIKTIVPFMFYGCMRLTQIDIPNSVTSIGEYAFYGCSGLTSVTIPNSVTSIGNGAFSDCYNLSSVTIGNSVTHIGESAFGCMGFIGDYIFGSYCNLTNIVVASDNTTYDSRNNCNAIIETASNTLIVGGANTTIPNSVTSIGNYAFDGCCPREIDIPNSVTYIGDYAFYNWIGLISITIPNSVTYIGDEAFGHNEYHYSGGGDPYDVYSYILDPSQVKLGNDIFRWWDFFPILHVPHGSSQAYLTDGRWCPFDTIVEIDLAMSIEINVTMTSLNVGKTFQLSAIVLPSNSIKTVTWTSSNPAVATVDADGLVSAHAIGTATITAMTTDGSNLSATCTVKIPAAGLTGDVDGDGVVSINDVTTLIDAILTGEHEGVYFESADLNLNGRLDIGDVTTIIDMLLNDIE